MNKGDAFFKHHSLFTAVAVLALAHSAFADDDLLGRRTRAVEAVVTPILDADPIAFDAPLPAGLGDAIDERELRESHGITLDFMPQSRLSGGKQPFIDTSRWEVGAFAGVVMFSADFEADPSYVIGATTRVPVTGLGELGLYAQVFISRVDRDLPFFYPDQSGTWYGIGLGLDYTLWKGTLGYIRPQLGVIYVHWGGVNSLDNGPGITIGVQLGLFWVRNSDKTAITLMPQFQMQKSDHLIFLPIGFSVDF